MSPYHMSVDNPASCRVNVENSEKKTLKIFIPHSRNIVSRTETRGELLLRSSCTNKRYYIYL